MTIAPPPFPTSPMIGEGFGGRTWNGSSWGCGGQMVVIRHFPATVMFTPSPGMVCGWAECIGAGGGGGGATASAPEAEAGWICGGGGGSSGQYCKKAFNAAAIGGGVLISIGNGGAGGGPTTPGGPGGLTSFGSLCVALGGNGGDASVFQGDATPANLQGEGGARAGGPGSAGDMVSSGNAGLGGTALYWTPSVAGGIVTGGDGGPGFFGGLSQQARANQGQVSSGPPNGENAQGYWGCGGSGGASGAAILPAYGSMGGQGICVVTEFCLITGASAGCGCGGARVAIGCEGGFDD